MIEKYGRTSIFVIIFIFLIGCVPSQEIRRGVEVEPKKSAEEAKREAFDKVKTRMDRLMARQEELFEKGTELSKKIDTELERTKEISGYLGEKEEILTKELVELKEKEKVKEKVEVKVKERVVQIRIGILNGCGKKGMASRLQAFLTDKGFNVQSTGNADNFNYRKSIVYYKEKYREEAIDIAHKIPGWQDIYQMKVEEPDIDISIVVGKDLIKKIK